MIVENFYVKACEHFNFPGWRITNNVIYLENTDGSVTEKQIKDKAQELFEEWQNLQYQRDRASQYPSINDVVVALAEKEEGDDTMWQEITALRQKVKSENPKPT